LTTETAQDFPITWTDPSDAERSWFFDTTHTPDVMTPLGYDLYYGPFISGFGGVRPTYVNRYCYMTNTRPPPPRDAQMPEIDLDRLANGARRWRDEIIPEVVLHTQYYRDTDFDEMTNSELIAEIEKLRELRVHQGRLHEKALTPFSIGMWYLIDTYKELTGGDDLGAVRLVQGYGSKSVEAGHSLWSLSRIAASVPSVREAVMSGAALDQLAANPESREFLDAFRAFLDEFGWRSELFEFAKPTWAEEPSIPLQQLKMYLDLPDYDPSKEQKKLAEDRERAIAETMASLDDDARARLSAVIDVARQVVSIQEDHNYYIDQRMAMMPRRLALAAGRRLVSDGFLADADDVFYLTGDQLAAALGGGLPDTRGTVEGCKEQMTNFAAVEPPQFIGAPPPEDQQSAFVESIRSEREDELKGNGASPGVARGTARVLMSIHEGARLRPREILVARTTMPPWTPLFAVAGGIVTETGGVLSHPAVTAREYGIPAVLAVAEATRKIKEGQLIEVDGDQGVVRILN
jgi:pyruvate,water dikinase